MILNSSILTKENENNKINIYLTFLRNWYKYIQIEENNNIYSFKIGEDGMNKKAISLIVLVITILILAILATTAIISLSNTNIIERANDAVVQNNLQGLKEAVNLQVLSHMASNRGKVEPAELYQELQDEFSSEGYTVSAPNEDGVITIANNMIGVDISSKGVVSEHLEDYTMIIEDMVLIGFQNSRIYGWGEPCGSLINPDGEYDESVSGADCYDSYSFSEDTLVIPSTLRKGSKNYRVTAVECYGIFASLNNTNIVIPEGITDFTFVGSVNYIASISIPSSLENITTNGQDDNSLVYLPSDINSSLIENLREEFPYNKYYWNGNEYDGFRNFVAAYND